MRRISILLLLVALVAALSSYLTNRMMNRECTMIPEHNYEWLNKQLELSETQKATLVRVEHSFENRENALRAELDEANRQLARTIAEENAYTPKVAAAVEHVHMCMGELQKASIAHLFELRGQLDEAQQEKLMRYVEQALGASNGE